MKYDLHIHSKYSSDGVLEVKEIIQRAKKIGLKGIAVTDHNTIRGGLEAKKQQSGDLKVVVGSEIMTNRGEIIGLFLTEEIESREIHTVVREIKNQNGLVIVPHPFDEMRHSTFTPSMENVKFIDALEVFNSRCIFQKYNKAALDFAEKLKLSFTAGSDAHYINEIGKGGIVITMDDVKEAIIKNKVKIFGKRSSIINHGYTKVLKTWRKTKSG